MNRRADIKENFEGFGVEVSTEVLDKCEEICALNNVDPEELLEQWMAFSVSNNINELSIESLAQMERNQFGKKLSRDSTPKQIKKSGKGVSGSLLIYNASREPVIEDNILSTYCTPEDNILSTYCSTPKRNRIEKRPAEFRTPEDVDAKKHAGAGRSPCMGFSPASFSPTVATPSNKYGTRTNAGQAVCEWGARPAGASWKATNPLHLQIQHFLGPGQPPLSANARYMYEKLRAKAAVLNDVIEWLGLQICNKNNLEEPNHLKILHTDTFIGYGRVCCDANGRINSSSVLLEGSRELSYGACVPVKLGGVDTYALFPGQIVVVEGTNPTAEAIVAEKVYSDASLPFSMEPLKLNCDSGSLHVVVAVGPFTQTDTMTYQPLEDLLMYVQEHQPHVLILCGPFLDANHPEVVDGMLAEAFDKVFNRIIEKLMRPLAGLHTQVVLVSSSRDAHHHPVYPTPPYNVPSQAGLHLMPDPCMLDVNGVIFGITATDVLMHIGREEICNPPQGPDRLGRLASHLIQQRSMYPLYPPPEDMNLDLEMWDDHTHLPVTPHVLILPSDFRYFLKNINGCMVVNPERLSKGVAGGTFARLDIKPTVHEDGSLVNSIYGQVVRI